MGKTIVTLIGKSGGVADGMKSENEAVNQYSSAINNKATKIVENTLGQLSQEEKTAYNSLSSEQKLAIQNQISESINKGKADNALTLIKQAISNVVSNPNNSQNKQQTSTNTVPFILSLDNTMLNNGYIKTSDGNYQKGDKLYKASGDMTSGVTITEIGNAPVKTLSQEQMNISQNLNACRTAANATLAKANQVIKYSSASGMLNGLMHAEYHNICDKNTNLIFEVAKLGGYDSPNISNQISIVNRLSKELDSLCDAYIAKDKGMSDSFYNTLDKAGLVPGLSVATASVSAIGKAFDEKHSEDGLTLAETGKIVTEFCFNAFAGKLLSKIPGFDKFANTLAKKAFNYCGNNVTKTKIFEFMQNYGLSELSSLIASSDS